MPRPLVLGALLMTSLIFLVGCGGEGQETATTLVLTHVRVDSGDVVISGTTDLPDGTRLIVGFDVSGRSDTQPDIGVQTLATVSQGVFEARIPPPRREEFREGPYEISVSFEPRDQNEAVLFAVGLRGQKLSGPLVVEVDGVREMVLIETRDLQLSVTPLTFSFQGPAEFEPGTAERALAEYARAWRDRDWEGMARLTEKTWVTEQTNPARLLEGFYQSKALKGFVIIDVEQASDLLTRITFIVQWETAERQIIERQITAGVIKGALHSSTGERVDWGVDPLSTLTGRAPD